MKHYILPLVFFVLTLSSYQTKAAELTIGEVFNLQVGDSLRYASYQIQIRCSNFNEEFVYNVKHSIKIISKEQQGDTLTYVYRFNQDTVNDTVMINNLDSAITTYRGILNPYTYSQEFFNARFDSGANGAYKDTISVMLGLSSVSLGVIYFEVNHRITYVNDVGVFHNERYGGGGGDPWATYCWGRVGFRLIYYQSDSASMLWSDTSSQYYLNIDEYEEEQEIAIYPNPASNTLFISAKSHYTNPVDINLYNILGVKLRTYSKQLLQTEEIDIQDLNEGTYFIEISDGQSRVIKKFVVQQ